MASGDTLIVWDPWSNDQPASNFATKDTRNGHRVLDFDGSTDEEAMFTGVLPAHYAGGGLTLKLHLAFTSATSGASRWQADIERIGAAGQDIDSDGFTGTFQGADAAPPGTSGQIVVASIAFTSGAQMDSLAAGEAFRLKIRRDADGTSGTDNVTSDAELVMLELKET
jgi:hypothetical protein